MSPRPHIPLLAGTPSKLDPMKLQTNPVNSRTRNAGCHEILFRPEVTMIPGSDCSWITLFGSNPTGLPLSGR
jgi:hypothetical protein